MTKENKLIDSKKDSKTNNIYIISIIAIVAIVGIIVLTTTNNMTNNKIVTTEDDAANLAGLGFKGSIDNTAGMRGLSDSDGGYVLAVQGTITSQANPGSAIETLFTDFCQPTNPSFLVEGFLSRFPGGFEYGVVECPFGCDDGQCLTAQSGCQDYDDGDNPDIASSVISHGNTYDDVCMSDTVMREYWCDENNNEHGNTIHTCPGQCSAGRCLPSCQDSDGRDKYTLGTTVYDGQQHMDICLSNSQVIEFYCRGWSGQSEVLDCLNGCRDGVCVTKDDPTHQSNIIN